MNEIRADFESNTKAYMFIIWALILPFSIIGIPSLVIGSLVIEFSDFGPEVLISPYSIIGILFLLTLILGFGKWYAAESLRRMSCTLNDKALKIKKGIFFRSEKNIPLEKITDVTIVQGPLLRYLNLYILNIETAGQSAPAPYGEGYLIGIKNAKDFRNQILEYRDRSLSGYTERSVQPTKNNQQDIFLEIYETLKRIEKHLSK